MDRSEKIGGARRFLCLWLPFLATERLQRARAIDQNTAGAAPSEVGVATLRQVSNTAYLEAVDAVAVTAGLRPGMTLASARAIHPPLVTCPMDPVSDRALLVDLGLWADRFTPLVALDGDDAVMLDVTGCTALFGGEEPLIALALAGLRDQGFTAHAALAASSGAAAALVRYAGLDEKSRPALRIPPGASLSEALGPLPVSALQAVSPAIGPEVLDGLARVGLRHIVDLLPMPRAALAARFGRALATALDKALGQAPRPIDPRPMPRPYRTRLRFPDPIGDTPDVEEGLRRLLSRLCGRLESEGRGGRRFLWTLSRTDGSHQSVEIGTARPARDADRLFRLYAEKIDTIDPGYGIDSMALAAPMVEDFETDQEALVLASQAKQFSRSFGEQATDGIAGGTTDVGQNQALMTVLDRLSNRLGSDHVFSLTPIDSHLPDRAQTRGPAARVPQRQSWPKTPPRPTKLFHRACPIEPLTAPKEGASKGPKPSLAAPTAFRIFGRRTLLRVLLGPERIAPEWWQDPEQRAAAPDRATDWKHGARDYFDVEDETGRRFWIYRTPAIAPPHQQRWFLHGMF